MSTQTRTPARTSTTSTFTPPHTDLVQRKCACDGTTGPSGECAECHKKRLTGGARLPLQTKLTIGQPGDKYEQEADRVADAVMRMSEPRVQRQDEPEEDEEEKAVNAKAAPGQTPEVTPGLEARISTLRNGGGRQLDPATRSLTESRFGHDFSDVRIHADGEAADLASTINARAFTVGRDLVFGAGQYAPSTSEGRWLLAHELTHVLQQQGKDD